MQEIKPETNLPFDKEDKDALEIKKLRAEIQDLHLRIKTSESTLQKQALEEDKLKAETDDIRLKMQTSKSTLWLEKLKVYPTYLTVIVAIIFGTIQYFQQRQQYLDQQARDQKFKISKEMIELVKQLNTPNASDLQRNAALELAFFGREAVPVLIENLDIPREDVANQAVINSLQSIVIAEKDPKHVVDTFSLLLRSANAVFERELSRQQPNITTLLAHINALGTLGVATSGQVDLRKKAIGSLESLLRNINKHTIDPEEKKLLRGAVKAQFQKLSG